MITYNLAPETEKVLVTEPVTLNTRQFEGIIAIRSAKIFFGI